MGILLAMEFLWHWRMQARGEGIMEAVSWLHFPAEVITFHSYGDYCSVGYLAKYTHSASQSEFCLSGTYAILCSMSYRRVILGYVECCREEQHLISNSVCQPQNALQCNKAFGEESDN